MQKFRVILVLLALAGIALCGCTPKEPREREEKLPPLTTLPEEPFENITANPGEIVFVCSYDLMKKIDPPLNSPRYYSEQPEIYPEKLLVQAWDKKEGMSSTVKATLDFKLTENKANENLFYYCTAPLSVEEGGVNTLITTYHNFVVINSDGSRELYISSNNFSSLVVTRSPSGGQVAYLYFPIKTLLSEEQG